MEFLGINITRKKKFGDLDTYEEEKKMETQQVEKKESGLKKLWKRTVFPDMIKAKKEDKAFKRQVYKEAKQEVRAEMKDKIKEQIKKDELDKLSGKKKKSGVLGKIGKEFASMGQAAQSKDIGAMMGMGGGQQQQNTNMGGGSPVSNDKINKMLGKGGGESGVTPQDNDNLSLGSIASDEKIKSMIGMGNNEPQQVPNKKKRKGKKKQVQQSVQETPEDKIKRMLS